MKNNKRITQNPKIMMGKPVIAGTRIPIYVILHLLSEGKNGEEIIADYPTLTTEDVNAAISYAAELTNFQEYENSYA